MTTAISYEDQLINDIVKELCKPQNIDLAIAVRDLGSETPDQSFMWGFHQRPPMSFDDFCLFNQVLDNEVAPQLGIEPDYRNSSARYDEYLKRVAANNDNASLDSTQSTRFSALIDKFDDGSWSGSFYGFIMRKVQYSIQQMWSN